MREQLDNPLDGRREIRSGSPLVPQSRPKHAYLGISGGVCTAIRVDYADSQTAQFVAGIIRDGGFVERVTIEVARGAYMGPWPVSKPETPLTACRSEAAEG